MKIADLTQYIAGDVPGCPESTIRRALLAAAIEFCRETLAWDEIQDPITLGTNTPTYDIESPSGARVVAIKQLSGPFGDLRPKTMAEIAQLLPDWQTAKSGLPAYYNSAVDLASIRVFPTPYQPNGAQLTPRVAYAPTLAATTLPDTFVEERLDALLDGARARLMVQPQKAWSNPQLAGYHKDLFEAAKVDTRIELLHDRTPGSIVAETSSSPFA